MPVKSQVLPKHNQTQHHPREIRNRQRLRTRMHGFRVQPNRSAASQESRDALRPSQTYPWIGQAPITRPMWRSRRIHPRCHRPKPPQTSKTQANGTRHWLTRRVCIEHSRQINAVAQSKARKIATFPTKSAHSAGCYTCTDDRKARGSAILKYSSGSELSLKAVSRPAKANCRNISTLVQPDHTRLGNLCMC